MFIVPPYLYIIQQPTFIRRIANMEKRKVKNEKSSIGYLARK